MEMKLLEILIITFFLLLLAVIAIYQIAEQERIKRKRHFKPSIIVIDTNFGEMYYVSMGDGGRYVDLTTNLWQAVKFNEYENAEVILEFVKHQYPKAKLREI